ncbi:hypothetical protein CCMSSC00406_0001548 [Pleurotus cornucopiae]|uniref:Uncharacterized protein n=1 Tax=Pleurotus cornucopiae TaxID=5321 RepID=A0ACB7ING4_PLECO|nr:hypothetical protein CCMSSC00406_0001548 [Pleurotus cornucopiae]
MDHLDSPADAAGPSQAPARPLPTTSIYAVEYPGYVKLSSVPQAIENLGGQACLENAFKRTNADGLVELKLRPHNPFSHPIPGETVPTNNIILKIVKRKRKQARAPYADGFEGEYTATAVGVATKTVRFRSMADYQYQPNPSDSLVKLRHAMETMDIQGIRSYAFPEEKEDYGIELGASSSSAGPAPRHATDPNLDPQLLGTTEEPASTSSTVPSTEGPQAEPITTISNLRMFPPPVFSRQLIPMNYGYKANPASVVSTVVDEKTGEEKKRLINRMRWKGLGPASIMFQDEKVPDKPPQSVEAMRSQMDGTLLQKMQEYFAVRPIWTRHALMNQFSVAQAREIVNSKVLLPLVCYVFQDGPYRDTLVRFGYDPRKDPSARFYQRIYFRNSNHPIERPSVVNKRQERSSRTEDHGGSSEAERKGSHIFDGVTLTKETAAFQLCDITDPMLKQMIDECDDLRDVCNERDGWYTTHSLERIKTILRHKFFSLLDGYPATDEECVALLETQSGRERLASRHVPRPGKHNMAKGALRPEDAAALRLRATLDRSIKNVPSQKQ